ncbi:hypothetical protein ACH4U7_46505 [Streptomyces sp. NPDC020845]|uniref:hypothetical protein n=1 Tax=Streptomyces sp. NPDC020845 TaxID=3365096 RepID=UPI003789FCCA
MAAGEKVTVPAEHRDRTHQQPHSAEHVHGKPVQQRRQKCPVARGEPHPLLAELALQHHDLMAQGEYLDSLVPIAHR